MSKLIENDVRLMRRILIALRYGGHRGWRHQRGSVRGVRELDIVLPDEQTKEFRERYLNRLLDKEKWLSREYGCILLPDYYDCIFLNSKWANPYTMYVRLVAPVDELDALGEIYWLPDSERKEYLDFAEKNHAAYLKATVVPGKPRTWLQKMWDGITINR